MENLWKSFDEAFLKEESKQQQREQQQQKQQKEFCSACLQFMFYSDEGFLSCSNAKCGLIDKNIVDHSAEWRYYGAEDSQMNDPTRCGLPINPLLHESSFGCRIISNGRISYELRKMKRYIEWQSMPYKEKAQYEEFQRISIMCQNAGIPKIIIDTAVQFHKQISEYELTFRGENRDGILAASIYISCKVNNYPRTSKEISQIFNLDASSATKGCKNIQLIMNRLEKDLLSQDKTILCRTKPESFVDRFCSKLNMNNEHKQLCHFVCKKIESLELMPENTPHSIATGVIYYVSQLYSLNVAKRDVKLVSSISEVTINKCCKKIEKQKHILIPPVILKKFDKSA